MWFTENPWPPIAICGFVAIMLLFAWSTQKRLLYVLVAAGLLLLCVGIFVLEKFVVTDAERIEQNVETLCRAFQKKDIETTLSFFSPQAVAERAIVITAAGMVTIKDDLRISDVSVQMKANNSRAISHFRANATIDVVPMGNVGYQPSRWEFTWQRQGDGWKIIKVTRLNPLNGEVEPYLGGR